MYFSQIAGEVNGPPVLSRPWRATYVDKDSDHVCMWNTMKSRKMPNMAIHTNINQISCENYSEILHFYKRWVTAIFIVMV